jgi:hypothetical protein
MQLALPWRLKSQLDPLQESVSIDTKSSRWRNVEQPLKPLAANYVLGHARETDQIEPDRYAARWKPQEQNRKEGNGLLSDPSERSEGRTA